MNTQLNLLARAQISHGSSRRYADRAHTQIDHDTWNVSQPKLRNRPVSTACSAKV
jgi:hypothetical protein